MLHNIANECLSSYTFLYIITFHCAGSPPPVHFVIEQISPTTIRAQWVVQFEGTVTITYIGGSRGSVAIFDTLTTETLITGLKNGANYTMSIVVLETTLDNFPSRPIVSNVLQLGIIISFCMNHFS